MAREKNWEEFTFSEITRCSNQFAEYIIESKDQYISTYFDTCLPEYLWAVAQFQEIGLSYWLG